jgi:hypothetical protein
MQERQVRFVFPTWRFSDLIDGSRSKEVLKRQKAFLTKSEDLLAGVRRWVPASVTQQDDITLIVIDIAQSPRNVHPEIVETVQASF